MKDINKSLFEFENYRDFLKKHLGDKSTRTGLKTVLAEKLNIKASFLSRILKGDADLTAEQSILTCQFFSLNSLEQEFFVTLVNYDRAGTFDLKTFYKNHLERLIKESHKIEKRINQPTALNEKDNLTYYSRWIYLAVHVAVSVPQFKSLRSIIEKFNLKQDEAQNILDFLVETNIISYDSKNRVYNVGPTYTHIGNQSDLIYHHHYNWRIKALEDISQRNENSLHYSAVFSLSKQDALSLKNNFLELIKKHVEIMKPSKEEALYCQTIDFFEI